MELKKRDCDIKIKLLPLGDYWLKVDFEINGEHLKFMPSSAMAGQFGDFLNALYGLFMELNNYDGDNHREPDANKHWIERDGIEVITTKTQWDEEGTFIDIIFERRVSDENRDYSDSIDLSFLIHRDEYTEKRFTIDTKEFCYAVAKACTEVLKEFGFYGYHLATDSDSFKLYQLLYIKALALDCLELRHCLCKSWEDLPQTDFKKETELLLFDM